MLDLQEQGCHNINFVTPEHVVPEILEALPIAIERGLRLPIVYNTSAYDSMESLAWMDGIVDIYMPDFKLWTKASAMRYLKAKDYPEVARRVVAEMHRQVGPLTFDEQRPGAAGRTGAAPGDAGATGGDARDLPLLARRVSPETYVNVMGQYRPEYRAEQYAGDQSPTHRRRDAPRPRAVLSSRPHAPGPTRARSLARAGLMPDLIGYDDGPGPAHCKHCGALAVGPCARCHEPVCGDCCVLTEGGAKVWAICLACDRRAGRSSVQRLVDRRSVGSSGLSWRSRCWSYFSWLFG